ncbi:MAG: hypothetical protein FE78DRAFT_150434 [Acidomyces sp. 'richmondensis']|nr:MAG: hypothetical protein FE78DRAFT_150434 [Acidomyces sp. 'richmondensis']
MDVSIRDSYALSESNIQKAIAAYQAKRYRSIRATTHAFSMPYLTLHSRIASTASRRNAHKREQLLLSAEESILYKWIT